MENMKTKTGTVKWYDVVKGYGFIHTKELPDTLFVHVSRLSLPQNARCLLKGEQVEYSTKKTARGDEAFGVRPLIEQHDKRIRRLSLLKNRIETYRITVSRQFMDAIRSGLSDVASKSEINDVLNEFRKAKYITQESTFEFDFGDGKKARLTTSNVERDMKVVLPLIKEALQKRRLVVKTPLGEVAAEECGASGGSDWFWPIVAGIGGVILGVAGGCAASRSRRR